MQHIVEVHQYGDGLAAPMSQMREWLDAQNIEPTLFRLSLIPGGTVFRLEFRSRTEAARFADAFGGQIITYESGARAA